MTAVAEIQRFISSVTAVVAGTPRTAASVNAGLTDLANRTKWLKERFYDLLLGAPLTVSAVDTGTDRLTVTGHSIPANTAVQVFAANGGTLPGGVSASTPYWVGVVDANTIQLYTAAGPSGLVDLTAGFAGDVYVQIIPDWFNTLLINNATYGTGKLGSLIMWLAGAQTVTGAKTFNDAKMSGTNKWGLTSRGVQRLGRGVWVDGAGKAYAVGGSALQDDVSKTVLELPNGATLTEISVWIDPADHTGTGLPGTMPYFQIIKTNTATQVGAQVGTNATDASANPTDYSALHVITKSGLSEVIDNATYVYSVAFYGEQGANKADITVLSVPKWSCTVTAQDDGSS